jgi:signal peptidase II
VSRPAEDPPGVPSGAPGAEGVSRESDAASPPNRGPSRARLAGWLYAVAAAVYVADRVSKLLAEHHLQGRPPIKLVPGVLDLSFTTNSGGAFGLFGGASWLFFAASVLVGAVIAYASLSLPGRALAVGLGLVLGGALGNVTDRLVNRGELDGQVVDFIHLHHWPVFNVADSAIVVGAAVLLLASLRRERGDRVAAS